eukprot:CAMPEP_0115372612 /NCGR_PEP_ID=MMETSP0271-20121206/996_1 /TAXON_ID=71861 /ORGANISM="Scrippsiella trochoidea, Strain CCMP3099" /LENGTH=128 /DNA_ID=CAMNT_0002795569 /DNA_START=599 /DNA_END=981 /DNA_ORIENTATION=-
MKQIAIGEAAIAATSAGCESSARNTSKHVTILSGKYAVCTTPATRTRPMTMASTSQWWIAPILSQAPARPQRPNAMPFKLGGNLAMRTRNFAKPDPAEAQVGSAAPANKGAAKTVRQDGGAATVVIPS